MKDRIGIEIATLKGLTARPQVCVSVVLEAIDLMCGYKNILLGLIPRLLIVFLLSTIITGCGGNGITGTGTSSDGSRLAVIGQFIDETDTPLPGFEVSDALDDPDKVLTTTNNSGSFTLDLPETSRVVLGFRGTDRQGEFIDDTVSLPVPEKINSIDIVVRLTSDNQLEIVNLAPSKDPEVEDTSDTPLDESTPGTDNPDDNQDDDDGDGDATDDDSPALCGDGSVADGEECEGSEQLTMNEACTTTAGYSGDRELVANCIDCIFSDFAEGQCTSEQFCGDNVCNGPETPGSCADDCSVESRSGTISAPSVTLEGTSMALQAQLPANSAANVDFYFSSGPNYDIEEMPPNLTFVGSAQKDSATNIAELTLLSAPIPSPIYQYAVAFFQDTQGEWIATELSNRFLVYEQEGALNQQQFFVNPTTGNDSNDGSFVQPFETLQRVENLVGSTINEGAVVFLDEGDFGNFDFNDLANSDYITLTSIPGKIAQLGYLRIIGGSFWRITHLNFERCSAQQMLSLISSPTQQITDVEVGNNHFEGASDLPLHPCGGIRTSAFNVSLLFNTMENVTYGINAGGVDNGLIKGNDIDDYSTHGLHLCLNNSRIVRNTMKNSKANDNSYNCVSSNAGVNPCFSAFNFFLRNICWQPPSGGLIGGISLGGAAGSSFDNWTISNNLIIQNHTSSLYGVKVDDATNTTISNNTIMKNSASAVSCGIAIDLNQTNTVVNNLYETVLPSVDDNLRSDPNRDFEAPFSATYDLTNYSLKTGSPAINFGSVDSATTGRDLNGMSRCDSAPDAGALEQGAQSNCSE